LAVVALLGAACTKAAGFENWIYRNETVRYRVGALPGSWERIEVSDGQVAFIDRRTSATISADASCSGSDAPLAVLTSHRFIGITERKILSQEKLPFDGREALRTRIAGKLDGVLVEIEIMLLKKDGCVYDLVYTAAPDAFLDRRGDFDAFVSGFRKLSPEAASP
jgi:hypothetical protein